MFLAARLAGSCVSALRPVAAGAWLGCAALIGTSGGAAAAGQMPGGKGEAVTDPWRRCWDNPGPELRPLQIVHDFYNVRPKQLLKLKQLGLGGVVANVSPQNYLQSEQRWREFGDLLAACKRLGLRVWIYDEEGYPSGAAGGLVLRDNPEYEALALAFDEDRPDPFRLERAYEHSHASHNYHLRRRFPNLIDDRAVRAFIENTHEAYFRHFESYFGGLIEAFFTDEPSLMDVNLSELSPELAQALDERGGDPVDPSVKALPRVPWVYDLEMRYRDRYGDDLLPLRDSLFEGDSPSDREVRLRFWRLVGDLFAERYIGGLEQWCHAHRVASSGHMLAEESLIAKIPLEGNALENLRRMDIPGLDMLTSDPRAAEWGWLTALLPTSAAIHSGRRRVMTEVSDFIEGGRGAQPEWMRPAAAWQAAFGVTEFTLYYQPDRFSPPDYRAYTDYVGRLNAVLREARPDPGVLLYYPVTDLMAEYLPAAEPIYSSEPKSPRARALIASFERLGRMLVRRQIPFALADDRALERVRRTPEGLQLGYGRFEAFVVPSSARLPASPELQAWIREGGRVISDSGNQQELADALETLPSGLQLSPPSDRIVAGRFLRDGRPVLVLVNTGDSDYEGQVALPRPGRWERWDPATGQISVLSEAPAAGHKLALPALGAVLLIESG
jgi:hypothetical protein